MITIKDIAKKLNLSTAAVSKALNGYDDISEATRILVRKTAQEMGYMPNAAARALKTKCAHNLGVLFADEGKSGLRHPYFSHVLDGFRSMSEKLGYDVTFIGRRLGFTDKMTYLERCRFRGVDGVCVVCIDFQTDELSELITDRLPMVAIDYAQTGVANVFSANRQGMSELVRHIVELGHRKIAYIYGQQRNWTTHERIAGYQNTLISMNVPVRPEWLIPSEYQNEKMTVEKTKLLLEMPERPTCIIYADDKCAFAGMKYLREQGIRIPQDISVAGFDGVGYTLDMYPRLTTVVQDAAEIGRQASVILINRIERPFLTPVEDKFIACKLSPGDTVSDINA